MKDVHLCGTRDIGSDVASWPVEALLCCALGMSKARREEESLTDSAMTRVLSPLFRQERFKITAPLPI